MAQLKLRIADARYPNGRKFKSNPTDRRRAVAYNVLNKDMATGCQISAEISVEGGACAPR